MSPGVRPIVRFPALLALLAMMGLPAMAAEVPVSLAELEELLPGLGSGDLEQLLSTGELSRYFVAGDELKLVPGAKKLTEISEDLRSIEFSVGVEVVQIFPEPYPQFSTAELATKLLEVSTLAGLEYYSESKGRMRTLFVDSYTVDNAQDRDRINDPVVYDVPSAGEATVFQEDTTFGGNVNIIEYAVGSDSVHMLTTNASTFSWGFVPIIQAGRLRSHLLLIRTDTFLIYYANFGAQALRVNFFQKRIHDSFYNRLVALEGWFGAKLAE